jgi:hypothetical protein
MVLVRGVGVGVGVLVAVGMGDTPPVIGVGFTDAIWNYNQLIKIPTDIHSPRRSIYGEETVRPVVLSFRNRKDKKDRIGKSQLL